MCQLKKIRSKPNLHVHDFSRWPPFDIGNIFCKFCSTRLWYEHCNSIYQVSCQRLYLCSYYDLLKYFTDIQRPPFLKWLLFPQNFNFQI